MHIARESIFVSSLRALFKVFAIIVGIGLGFFVISLGLGAVSHTVSLPDQAELTVGADADGNRTLLPSTTPVILRMDIHGVIGTKHLNEETFTNMFLSAREGALTNNRVKGILLHVNTPGGLASTSNVIYRLIKSYKEKYQVPVYVYVEGICASGGMYIASAADQIFASEDSVLGSVGVIMGPLFNVSQVMQKFGIEAVTLTEGKDKDSFNPFRSWKEGEGSSIKGIIEQEYQQFVDIVVKGRPRISRDTLVNEYGAQVFLAPQAQELGYADHGRAEYTETLTALAKAAGIEGKYQVMTMAPPQSFLEGLTHNRFSKWSRLIAPNKVEHVFPLGPYMTSDMSGKLLYLYQP